MKKIYCKSCKGYTDIYKKEKKFFNGTKLVDIKEGAYCICCDTFIKWLPKDESYKPPKKVKALF